MTKTIVIRQIRSLCAKRLISCLFALQGLSKWTDGGESERGRIHGTALLCVIRRRSSVVLLTPHARSARTQQ